MPEDRGFDVRAGALCALAYFAFGLPHAGPSTAFGDSGEFLAVASFLGVAHAPGYPLYSLLAKALGSLIPFGTWAYRVNLVNLFYAAAAAGVLVCTARRLGASRAAAALGVALVALTPLPLHQSGVTEAFTLNALIAAAVFAVAADGGERWAVRHYALAGLLFGLGLGNHQTLVFLVPAAAFAGWRGLGGRAENLPRMLGWTSAFFLLGFAVHAYVPIRAAADPPFNWGHAVDLGRFWDLLRRKDYGSFSLTLDGQSAAGAAGALRQVWRFCWMSAHALGPAGLAAAAAGLGWAAWKRLPGAAFAGLALLFCGPGFLLLGRPPFNPVLDGTLERFLLLPWILAAVPAALLIEAWQERLGRRAWTVLAAPLALAWLSAPAWSSRGDLAGWDYARNTLKSAPPGAALFIDGGDDTFYTLAYLMWAEGRRGDLRVHDRGGVVFKSAYGEDFRRLDKDAKEARRAQVESAIARERPLVYSTMRGKILDGRRLDPLGLLKPAADPRSPAPRWKDTHWPLYAERFSDARLRHYRYRALVPVYAFLRAQALLRTYGDDDLAVRWLRLAHAQGPDIDWLRGNTHFDLTFEAFERTKKGEWAGAVRLYRELLRTHPDDVDAWTNLGISFKELKRFDDSAEALSRAAALAPDKARAWYNLGTTYWLKGDWNAAAQAMAKAYALEPNPDYARFRDAARARAGAGSQR